MPARLVLFACVHNAGRSQMAAALFNAVADPARARALSAGTSPGAAVHPEVLETMREIGIDLASARPRAPQNRTARGVWHGPSQSMTTTAGLVNSAAPVVGSMRAP